MPSAALVAEITRDYDKAMNADGLLVPGVGAFAACMDGLKAARGDWIVDRRLSGGRPVMGICVGMQILFSRGIEHDVEAAGLDEWPGTVGPLQADVVPHMGWNELSVEREHPLVEGVDSEYAYFVHSYYAEPEDADTIVATTDYEIEFPAIVANEAGNVFGTQFHPEKSGETGLQILRNFVGICAEK